MADWTKILSRGNVEDRRGYGPAAIGGGAGLVGIALYALLSYLGTGTVDVGGVLSQLQDVQSANSQPINKADFEGQDSYEVFSSTVLGSTNDLWKKTFSKDNKEYQKEYQPPLMVLFRGSTDSACGGADSRVGPHYCPLDKTIYLDETFFDELKKLGAQGDVAQAYVIAHEVGHNVQNQLGILDSEKISADSIKIELQADCFAGLWANSVKDLGVFEPGEIKEAMDAASAVGDDRVQAKFQGRVNPETWTHGSAAQRLESFTRGFNSISISACM